jgi:hypothetical protein
MGRTGTPRLGDNVATDHCGKSVVAAPLVNVLLCATAIIAAVLTIISFWPGSIGPDFPWTLMEAKSWQFSGHQPPSAAFATALLTLGTANPSMIFVEKVLVYFSTLVIIALWSRAPLLIRIGGAVIIFSPVFLYLAPLLRSNGLEAVFLGLAVVSGLSGGTNWHAIASFTSLLFAALFAPAIHLGHLALIVLYFLWRNPSWSLVRTAKWSAISMAALYILVAAANFTTGNVDRSSTLYASALNGIGGLYNAGENPCLSTDVLRGEVHTAEEVFANYYTYPNISGAIWQARAGFKWPEDVSPMQRRAVIDCWARMAMAQPRKFIAERLRMGALSVDAWGLEGQFASVWNGREYLHTQLWDGYKYVEPSVLARAIIDYGYLGQQLRMATFKTYLALFALTSLGVLFFVKGRRIFVLFGALAVLGFVMPQLLFGQAASFRYFVTAAYLAAWLSLAHLWLLVGAFWPMFARWLRLAASARGRIGRSTR